MRRLARSAILAVLLVALTGGLVGFVSADDGPADAGAVPAPRPGDSATYAVSEFILDPDVEPSGIAPDRYVLTWLEPRWQVDAEFTPRLVHPLRMEAVFGEHRYLREAAYDAYTGAPVATSGEGESYYRVRTGGVLGTGVLAEETQNAYAGDWFTSPGICGMRSPLHDGRAPTRPLRMSGACDHPWNGRPAPVYDYVGKGRVGEGDALRTAWHYQDPEATHLEAWYAPGVPFPVRLTSSLQEVMDAAWGRGRAYRMELTDYRPGSGAYPALEASALGAGLGPAPVVPLGDAPGGVEPADLLASAEAAFPFADAYALARADGLGRGLGDAYLAEAFNVDYTDRWGQVHRYWFFLESDGHRWDGRMVADGPAGTFGLYAEALGRQHVVHDWSPSDLPDGAEGVFPPRDRLPATAPPLAGVQERATFLDEGRPLPGHVMLSIRCGDDACRSVHLLTGAGLLAGDLSDGTGIDAAVSGSRFQVGRVFVGPDGRAESFWQFERTHGGLVTAAARPQATGPPEVAAAVPGWNLPSRPALVGLSALAVLAAALYHVAPTLKAALLAGFSRTEHHRVLDHPTRRALHDAIHARPGIHFQELARIVPGRGRVEGHVRKLIEAGLVVRHVHGGYACYFPQGTDRRLLAAAGVLKAPGARALLLAAADRPGTTERSVAVEMGLAPSTVNHHARRLHEAGLLEKGRGLRATPLGLQAKAAFAS